MKKLVSMLLALSMVLSVFCMIPMPVAARDLPGEVPSEPSDPSNTLDKTASMLIGDRTEVTLTVPSESEALGADIIYIAGAYLAHDAVEADLMVNSIYDAIKEVIEGGTSPVSFGFVPFSYNDKPVMELTPYYTVEQLEKDFKNDLRKAISDAADAYGGENMDNALQIAKNMFSGSPLAEHPERQHLILVSSGHTYNFNVGENNDIFSTVPVAIENSKTYKKIFFGYKAWMQARNANGNTYPIPKTFTSTLDSKDWDAYWAEIEKWAAADKAAGDKGLLTISDTTDNSYTYYDWYVTNLKSDNKHDNTKGLYKSYGVYFIGSDKFVDAAYHSAAGSLTTALANVPDSAKHAISYERAMWEASTFIDKQITGAGINFYPIYNQMKPAYTNGIWADNRVNSDGTRYNYSVKWTNQYIGHSFMDMLARNVGMEKAIDNSTATNKAFFDPIKEKIVYYCSRGSIVEDYIGKNENGNFEFVKEPTSDKETLQDIMYLTKAMPDGSTMVYTTAQVDPVYRTDVSPKTGMEYGQADASYTFTAKGASTPSFWLDYYYGNGDTTEMFVWSFGEDISRYYPVSLTYTLELTEKQPIPSTDGLGYDVNTNNSATLYPVDSNGNPRDPEDFPIPWVNYDVVDKTEIAIVLAVLPHLVANNLGEGQDHTQNALYNLLAPVMNSGLYDVRLGLITVEMQQQVLLDARSPESLLPENEADWVKMLNDILVPAKNLYVGPTGVENNINRAIEMFGEQDANGNSLDHIDAANKYFYLVATGRSYWFENDEGQALTIATKVVKNNVTYAIWNERTWKIARNGNANVYPVPVYFGTGADAYEKYFKWFSDLAKNDEYNYAYIVNCGSENNANFKNWAKANGTELRAGANNTTGDRYASFIVDPNSDSDLYGSGFLYYDANVGFDVNVLPNGKHNAMSLSNSKADPANVAHALNYEVGQYEAYLAWMKMLDEGYNCISVCSEDVRYQNYSPYLAQGSWNYSSPQIGHSFMDYLAKQNETQAAASLIYVMSDPTATTYATSGAAGTYYNVMTTNFFPAVVDSEDNLLDYHLNKNTTPALAVEPRPRLLFANPPKPQAVPVITEQPAVTDIAAKNNEIISASIQATGKEISYKWFFVDANGNEIPTGVETNVYVGQMKPEYDKLSLKCKVTDKNGKSVESNAIRLSYVPTELKILAQSDAVIVANNNEYAYAFVNAQGEGLTYVWFVKDLGSAGWNISSLNSPVYAVKMSSAVSGRQVYCVVFDTNGKSVTSSTFTLTCSAPASAPSVSKELKITNVLPEAITVAKKATATVTIEAQGEGLTYTWYFQNDGANNWSKASETGNTYSLAMTAGRSGRKVYCEVTDINGNMVKSAVVTLLMEGAK